ncbi:hypothetical protein GCM10011390_02640 [Aureimonas endophytica]|uniref:Uncharacterized protein n=1 Tax=Aureimonas endophytica TaxID=2027858 RepID=A0A917E158_9HYPH|nr:hypothetical protein [Aureimonas endophytica]GGD87395.1 hypothetical protein GCM10011390_02640 [Aureimonas endophytica]
MVAKTITQLRKERDQAAIRAARYRIERASRPDVRAVDKALSEAIAVHACSLPPEEGKALLERLVQLAADGLRYRGYGENSSRIRTARRLAGWTRPNPHSGSVRAAKLRDGITD